MSRLAGFFALTYLVTWTLWLASTSAGALRAPLIYLGVFTPGIVALWLTARREGREGVAVLGRRLVTWRVPIRWYAFALGYLLAMKLTAALVFRMLTGDWPRFGGGVEYVLLEVVASLALFWVQAGEEVGWRGYALPRLTSRIGLRGASIVLGVIWATWHLPLFFMTATTTTGQSFPLYLAQVTALSVAIAWLHAHTSGSLLLVMIMHAAINNTRNVVPSAVAFGETPFLLGGSLVGWITAALLWLGGAYFLARMPNGRTEPHGAAT